jgi:hypothetical protein
MIRAEPFNKADSPDGGDWKWSVLCRADQEDFVECPAVFSCWGAGEEDVVAIV